MELDDPWVAVLAEHEIHREQKSERPWRVARFYGRPYATYHSRTNVEAAIAYKTKAGAQKVADKLNARRAS